MKSCLWKLGLGFWTHGFIATSFGSKDENNLPPINDWMSGVTCCISFIHVAQQLPSCSCTSEFWKTLLAKPNPDANYFYLMRGELTKIGEYMTSFSKIVGKNKKENEHCHVLHSIRSHRSSKLFIKHTIAKDYFKDIFWDYFIFNKKTLCVVIIAIISYNVASLWKFQYFRRPIYILLLQK